MKRQLLPLLLVIFLATGCASKDEGVVSGTVVVDGEPAKMGSIAFIPADGQSTTAGAAISEGQYTATVPVGTAKVQIRVSKVVGETKIYNTPDSPIQEVLAEVLPAKYNDQTELQIEVSPGKNQQDFDLKSK